MAKPRDSVKFLKAKSSWDRSGRVTVPSKKRYMEALVQRLEKELNQLMKKGEPVRLTIAVDPRRMVEIPRIERIPIEVKIRETPEPLGERTSGELKAALSEAFERGEHLAAKILRQPDMLTAADFAASLNLSRETVRQKTLRHEILALRGAKQGKRFPAWQVSSDGGLLPELPKLFKVLGGNAWAVYRFLLQHHPELDGETAVDAIKAGKVEEVLAAAKNAGLAFS
jgi:hypothetical protein